MQPIEWLRLLFVVNWPITLACALGLTAVYVLLPRPRRMSVLLGTGAAVLALVLVGWTVVRAGALTFEAFLFYVFSGVAIVSGGLLVTQRNPARAALSFALVVLSTCGLFLLQAAPFLMAATIIVYAGAIIVTFLFVLMLSQQQGLSDADARSREPFLAAVTGFLLLGTLLYVLKATYRPDLEQWVERTGQHLKEVQGLRGQLEGGEPPAAETLRGAVAEVVQFVRDYNEWWGAAKYPSGGEAIDKALFDAQHALPTEDQFQEEAPTADDLRDLEQGLQALHEAGAATWNSPLLGGRRPTTSAEEAAPLSELSGPRSSRPPEELRRNKHGIPHLPAENTAYLGRSLFGDYLLAVELAGMLLLVATIGAIAIAQRRKRNDE